MCNPSIDPSNNRLTATTYGYNFDSAGNTTRDASDRKFTYDGENKQTKVESLTTGTNTVTGTVGEYSYDGDGKRVKKYVPATGETTVFVYDAAGKLIEEYSTIVETTNAKVAYLTNDHLGSPRINTDANGAITSRHDYHPFGEAVSTSQRTSGISYAGDTVRKQFTGYERDAESDLNFANARMYSGTLGRFVTTDPYNIVLRKELAGTRKGSSEVLKQYILDAQTWNKYSYVTNSPLNNRDLSGECSMPTGLKKGQTGICVEAFIKSARVKVVGHGDDRGHSGTDATLSNQVETKIIITPTENGGSHVEWKTETAWSWASPLILPPFALPGQSTTTMSNITVAENGDTTFGLSLTAVNGFSAYGGPAGDIALDLNIVATSDGLVGIAEGSEARTYPSLAIYRYSVAEDGSVTTTEVLLTHENDIDDLTKPKQPLPVVEPR